MCGHGVPGNGVGRSMRKYLEPRKREGIPLEGFGLCGAGEGGKHRAHSFGAHLAVFFGFTFGHIVLAPLQSPRALG